MLEQGRAVGAKTLREYMEFNVELANKHPDCLEYIVVHEMVHYLERNSGQRFTQLMDGFLPDRRSRRDQLNDAANNGHAHLRKG